MQPPIEHSSPLRSWTATALFCTLAVAWFCVLASAALWVAVAAYRAAAISH